jgi:hypothetical protein
VQVRAVFWAMTRLDVSATGAQRADPPGRAAEDTMLDRRPGFRPAAGGQTRNSRSSTECPTRRGGQRGQSQARGAG